MFNKKKKEIDILERTIIDLDSKNKRLNLKLNELENKQYANDQIIKVLEQKLYDKDHKYYKRYKYAILIDKNYKVKLWNEDRFENNVKEILFNAHADEIPEINIIK